jgi:NAD-dependent SIR2 family protein deacetylase
MVERIVYVLGAGASYDAGGPLIRDFFSNMSERSANVHSQYFEGDDKYSKLKAIYQDWAKTNANPNIEGFFKNVEFNVSIGKAFRDPRDDSAIESAILKRWLEWYIAAFVRNSVAFQRNPPKYYGEFAKTLKGWGKRYSIVTFNYDLVFEKAIMREFGTLDYKIGVTDVSYSTGIPFVKLHGALNWLWCPKCGRIEIHDQPVGQKYNRVACLKKCGGYKERLMVPPNPGKEKYVEILSRLWKKADKLLSEADSIVIVGYSLPEIDVTARELLAGPVRKVSNFDIVNNNLNALNSVSDRLGRKVYTHMPRTFRDYVAAISS